MRPSIYAAAAASLVLALASSIAAAQGARGHTPPQAPPSSAKVSPATAPGLGFGPVPAAMVNDDMIPFVPGRGNTMTFNGTTLQYIGGSGWVTGAGAVVIPWTGCHTTTPCSAFPNAARALQIRNGVLTLE